MIRITKPSKAPAILLSKGKTRQEEHCQDYLAHKADHEAGLREFRFDKSIYGNTTVKKVLMKAQYGQCCYCESKINQYDDVEHFRPKACYQQEVGDAFQTPGYYSLVYDWDNLLVSCAECNRGYKKNLFPLADPAKRATTHKDDITQETPLLLHPGQIDPEKYLSFREEKPFAVDGNASGEATIAAMGLDRDNLNEERRKRLDILFHMREILQVENELVLSNVNKQLMERTRNFLARAVSDAGEYAGMARAAAKYDFMRPF